MNVRGVFFFILSPDDKRGDKLSVKSCVSLCVVGKAHINVGTVETKHADTNIFRSIIFKFVQTNILICLNYSIPRETLCHLYKYTYLFR